MDKENRYILSVCPCGGKTYFRKMNPNILSYEHPNVEISRSFSSIADKKLSDYLNTFINKELFNNNKEILQLCFIGNWLIKLYEEGYPVIFVVPSRDSFYEYRERLFIKDKSKYTKEDFEETFGVYWDIYNKDKESVILLNGNQYLSDVTYPYLSEYNKYIFYKNKEQRNLLIK